MQRTWWTLAGQSPTALMCHDSAELSQSAHLSQCQNASAICLY